MTNYAIQVENLGKEYLIGGAEQRHESFRELLSDALASPLRKLRRLGGTANEDQRFWALKDINFNVEQGEVLGIVGRNGAGKSTLLKILSRITSPTEGKIVTHGRVASLLEVGTGFHPELTGKENIYLNGAILGMKRAEVGRKFSQIVGFADVGDFIDTPVKRYSSGMYVRLAFSVAAHLEPDVLLVDEVLAVGDVEFQKRCLGKMEEVVSRGRSVLFISHNLSSILALCQKVMWLDKGRIRSRGDTSSIVQEYLSDTRLPSSEESLKFNRLGKKLRIARAEVEGPDSSKKGQAIAGDSCSVLVEVDSGENLDELDIQIGVYDEFSRPLGILQSNVAGHRFQCSKGLNTFACRMEHLPLFPGSYILNVSVVRKNELLDGVKECVRLIVTGSIFFDSGLLPRYGPLLLRGEWHQSS